jgi:hypothetical protein
MDIEILKEEIEHLSEKDRHIILYEKFGASWTFRKHLIEILDFMTESNIDYIKLVQYDGSPNVSFHSDTWTPDDKMLLTLKFS